MQSSAAQVRSAARGRARAAALKSKPRVKPYPRAASGSLASIRSSRPPRATLAAISHSCPQGQPCSFEGRMESRAQLMSARNSKVDRATSTMVRCFRQGDARPWLDLSTCELFRPPVLCKRCEVTSSSNSCPRGRSRCGGRAAAGRHSTNHII